MLFEDFTIATDEAKRQAIEQARADFVEFTRRGFTSDEAAIYIERGIAPPPY